MFEAIETDDLEALKQQLDGGADVDARDAEIDDKAAKQLRRAAIAADSTGNVYAAGRASSNAFQITPEGVITEVVGPAGDGTGSILHGPEDVAVDSAGNLYVAGFFSSNAFKHSFPRLVDIPTLGPGALALFIMLLTVFGVLALRRRLATRSAR